MMISAGRAEERNTVKKVRTQEAVGEDPRKPLGAFPDRPLGRWQRRQVQPAQPPSNTRDSRFGGRKRGPACPTRRTRPGPPPAPGAGCSGATVARPACLSRRVSPRAGASCLRGTRAGMEDSRLGEDFFFSFPGLGGSRGARGRRGVVGTARSLRSARRRRGGTRRGTSGTDCFPEHLGAGSALRRRAGTCLLDEPALEAPEVPGSSGALPTLPGFRLRAPGPVGAPVLGGVGSYNVCDGISVDARWECLCICVSVCH